MHSWFLNYSAPFLTVWQMIQCYCRSPTLLKIHMDLVGRLWQPLQDLLCFLQTCTQCPLVWAIHPDTLCYVYLPKQMQLWMEHWYVISCEKVCDTQQLNQPLFNEEEWSIVRCYAPCIQELTLRGPRDDFFVKILQLMWFRATLLLSNLHKLNWLCNDYTVLPSNCLLLSPSLVHLRMWLRNHISVLVFVESYHTLCPNLKSTWYWPFVLSESDSCSFTFHLSLPKPGSLAVPLDWWGSIDLSHFRMPLPQGVHVQFYWSSTRWSEEDSWLWHPWLSFF